MSPRRQAWAVIPAGGDGTRLASLTSRDGKPVPKQYCALSGPRTLLRMALDRAERLVPASRTVTVVQPLTSSGGSASSEARRSPFSASRRSRRSYGLFFGLVFAPPYSFFLVKVRKHAE